MDNKRTICSNAIQSKGVKYMNDKNIINKNRLDAIELFINDFNEITNCLYDSELRISKADEYYKAMLLVKAVLEDLYYEWYRNIRRYYKWV